jgi:hypothetical protein
MAALSPDLTATWRYPRTRKGSHVKFHMVWAVVIVTSLACPLAAQAQGITDGAAHGAYVGNQAAGPIGAVVGGAVGGVVGGVEGGVRGVLGIQPTYASYPTAPPLAYRHRHGVRHSYRHVHTTHSNS